MAEKDGARERIIAAFKLLLQTKEFKRITIKNITDEADLFRATFYSYFPDKYAIFDAILEDDLFYVARTLAANRMPRDAIALVLRYFSENVLFYQRAFAYEGANSCTEALRRQLQALVEIMSEHAELKLSPAYQHLLSDEDIKAYLTEMLLFTIKYTVQNKPVAAEYKLRSEALLGFLLDGLGTYLEPNK